MQWTLTGIEKGIINSCISLSAEKLPKTYDMLLQWRLKLNVICHLFKEPTMACIHPMSTYAVKTGIFQL